MSVLKDFKLPLLVRFKVCSKMITMSEDRVVNRELLLHPRSLNTKLTVHSLVIAIKRTNSAVIATLQQSHEGLPKSIFLSQSSVESRD